MQIIGIQEAHDSSACLMIDGKIISGASEERFSKLKGDYGYPKNAIKFCLDFANVKSSELDIVALASHKWNPALTKIKRNANFSVNNWIEEQHKYWYPTLFKKGVKMYYYTLFEGRENFVYDDFYPMDDLLHGYNEKDEMLKMREVRITCIADELGISRDKVITITHEDCHTYYSYFSGFLNGENVVSLTAEGIGDYSNATLSTFNDAGRGEISNTKQCHIGHIYKYITLILGMKPDQHEYKVMGLAPYANKYEEEKSYKVFKDILKIDKRKLMPVYNKKPKDLYFHFKEALEGHRFDGIAAGLQKFTERILCDWVREISNELKMDEMKIIFAGGVAQNVKAVKAMAELPMVKDIYVPPAAGDASISIGACYVANFEAGNRDNRSIDNYYLGPEPNINDTIGRFKGSYYISKDLKGKYKVRSYDKNRLSEKYIKWFDKTVWNEEDIAKLLSQGNIIGRCSGRMEFGHRALGNRSILADPRNPQIVTRLNKAIKNRDFWMPFACTILEDYKDKYIERDLLTNAEDRFMTIAFDTTDKGKKDLAAAIHSADYTCRPQVLSRNDNPEFYDIIDEFRKLTGVGGILNTSLNIHGSPIVLGAKDALRVFENSDLDFLLLDDYLIGKK